MPYVPLVPPLAPNPENGPLGPVWVVDSDEVRFSLAFALSPKFQVESCESAEDFLANAPVEHPGCLVMEYNMPGLHGREVIDRLAEAASPVGVIFLTTHATVRTAVSAIEAGACGFWEKPVDPVELSNSVEETLRKSYEKARKLKLLGLISSLTSRERQIFELVCQGFTSSEIAEQLFLSQRTIEVHRVHISRKLGSSAVSRILYELVVANGDWKALPAQT